MRRFSFLFTLALACSAFGFNTATAAESPVKMPNLVVAGIPFEIKVESADLAHVPYSLMIIGDGDEAVYTHQGLIPFTILNVRVPSGGSHQIVLNTAGEAWESSFGRYQDGKRFYRLCSPS